MGDLIMTTPALRALKETFNCKLTVLTSFAGSLIAGCIPDIDEVIVSNLPWVKNVNYLKEGQLLALAESLKAKHFDAAVIFTVYSQSALPAALFCLMAGIPRRLAYARENPYELLTDWMPDKEPYEFIHHQVQRDLNLVKSIGAETNEEKLSLHYSAEARESAYRKLQQSGIDTAQSWVVFHAGVSEKRRSYPFLNWIRTGQLLAATTNVPILLTGSSAEKELTDALREHIGENAHSVAGLFNIEEFVAIIAASKAVVSVNTGTVHIAAAMQTPAVVLYALTNPQHTPWRAPHTLLTYSVKEVISSRNEVVRYVSSHHLPKDLPYPQPEEVANALERVLGFQA